MAGNREEKGEKSSAKMLTQKTRMRGEQNPFVSQRTIITNVQFQPGEGQGKAGKSARMAGSEKNVEPQQTNVAKTISPTHTERGGTLKKQKGKNKGEERRGLTEGPSATWLIGT